jgi:hypothetical protein
MLYPFILGMLTLLGWSSLLHADWTEARCDIYPKGQDHTNQMLPCTFAQRQGAISITRSDGITHELTPNADTTGHYHDQKGDPVYRQSGLGTAGLIFRFPTESVYVYWDTAALTTPPEHDNVTAPFTTQAFDATTMLRCRAAGASEAGHCPAGIARMEDKQASITIQSQSGEQFTINFMRDYINATNGDVDAQLDSDNWIVTTANGDRYDIPLAAIEGG